MSWGLNGTFYDRYNKKIIAEVSLDYLKDCMECAYSSEFADIGHSCISLDDEFYKEKFTKFHGYYKREILDSIKVEKMEDRDCGDDECYVVLEGLDEEKANKFGVFSYEKGSIRLYTLKEGERKGTTYTFNDVKEALNYNRGKYEEEKAEYERMEAQAKSLEFYNLSSEARNDFLTEKGYLKEALDDYKIRVDNIQALKNIFECFREDYYYVDIDKFGVSRYSSKYGDNRDVILFLEVI